MNELDLTQFEAVLGIDEEGRKKAHGRGASGEAQTALALWKGMVGTGSRGN